MLLKVDCLPNAVGKQPSIPLIYLGNAVGKQPSIPLIYLGRKWTLN